ncbi:MAG: riboflavin synthase [Candidatus Omnitrophica bacterium]|nr:riboflavin synthase [Candidatus Omnitrophota bacterium]MDD5236896.1 riboflavin synthase [Candidatus Omnitrophota bacterium]MDD5610007.1 riboflavin synthase [Candidatus Omnitrophota bacterium]
MFTGIIEELGKVKSFSRRATFSLLEVDCEKILEDTKIGDSISVNGVCLTVIEKKSPLIDFEVMPETLKKSNLGKLKINAPVNLERALKFNDRVGGHFISGHVDYLGVIRKKSQTSEGTIFEIGIPAEFTPFIVAKGSVAVDGISLTVIEKNAGSFTVGIIPHTLNNTTLKVKNISDTVNIECDMLAKFAKSALENSK